MFNRIIHIAEDEKFINSAYWQFETLYPQQNYFQIVVKDPDADFKYVEDRNGIFKLKYGETHFDTFIETLSDKDVVVFHSLSPEFYYIVRNLPSQIKCIWFCFGFEIYNDSNLFSENSLLDTITKKQFALPKETLKKRIKEKVRGSYRLINPKLPFSPIEIQVQRKREIMNRMNYLGSSFKEDYEKMSKFIGLRKKMFSFWYFPIERIVDVKDEIILDKPNVLIGNSGYKTGNHLDVFNKIKNYQFGGRKIIVPLNYGDESYIPVIMGEGGKAFSDAFQPITTFLELSQYNQIIQKCGVAILNNRRQQAVGNTIALLWFGSKVFLSNKNPFYRYLKRIRVIVFSYERDLCEQNISELLTFEQIKHNRNILFMNLNSELLLKELKVQMDVIYE